jgi:hypothetical protein
MGSPPIQNELRQITRTHHQVLLALHTTDRLPSYNLDRLLQPRHLLVCRYRRINPKGRTGERISADSGWGVDKLTFTMLKMAAQAGMHSEGTVPSI